jgi:hypothetical protein
MVTFISVMNTSLQGSDSLLYLFNTLLGQFSFALFKYFILDTALRESLDSIEVDLGTAIL